MSMVTEVNAAFGAAFDVQLGPPPTLDGHVLWEFSPLESPELQGWGGVTSADIIPSIALNSELTAGYTGSLHFQVETLAVILHELAHIKWSEHFWSVYATDPLYYAALASCHSSGTADFGPCDEAYAFAGEALGVCQAVCDCIGDGAPPNSAKVKKLREKFSETVKDCVDNSTECDKKNGTCGLMPMPSDWGGCPGSTCNC